MCRATATCWNSPVRCAVGDRSSAPMPATASRWQNLLAYLFEVTERFGMATRTELILLQRTMVVVGVARSLDPQINMWEVARPVVESYIRDNRAWGGGARP